ncbi:SRPBCC family protein [Knoellia sp. 3-2P3]|uniref:SRPBCC family protein n=1 Tax=unclassified Knoellia TaxID=2618719 RepID=UPI0023DB0242|nr:SRPBCC family protein [Knoellia sp. 3-2P3]MDF2091015.1 SRPBCC family protein [Knoellia sp. 3-2P3]
MSTMTAMTMHIEAPVETVFGYFKDPMALADLTTLDIEYDEVKETKEGTGTYFSWHSKIAGIPFEGFEVYTDVVPNQHITEKSSQAVMGTWDYTFEPEGTGTKVTMERHPRSFWRLPPLAYVGDLVTARMTASFVPRVKERIEAAAR